MNTTNIKLTTQVFLNELSKDVHELNKSKALEDLFIQLFSRDEKSNVVEKGFFSNRPEGVDFIISYSDTFSGIKLTSRIFVLTFSDEDVASFDSIVDAIATGVWAQEADAGIICITGNNLKRQLKWKNQITEMTKQLQIQVPIEMYTGNEVASFLIHTGLLQHLREDK